VPLRRAAPSQRDKLERLCQMARADFALGKVAQFTVRV
jgi:hypothetical protein